MNFKFGLSSNITGIDSFKSEILKKYLSGEVIADIGCASGKYAEFISKMQKFVIAVDLDYRILLKKKSIKSLVGSISSLPFKNKSVDTSVLFDVLEHVDENCLLEVIRVTKSRIIAIVPRTTDKVLFNNWLLFGHHRDISHLRTYTVGEIEILLKKYYLRQIKIEPSHALSTPALFLDIIEGPVFLKKLFRRIVFTILKPKIFYSNISFVADISENGK